MLMGKIGTRANDADRQFATQMIKHHQAAIDMSEWLLRNGDQVRMKLMARRIIKAQAYEIKILRAFLASGSAEYRAGGS